MSILLTNTSGYVYLAADGAPTLQVTRRHCGPCISCLRPLPWSVCSRRVRPARTVRQYLRRGWHLGRQDFVQRLPLYARWPFAARTRTTDLITALVGSMSHDQSFRWLPRSI